MRSSVDDDQPLPYPLLSLPCWWQTDTLAQMDALEMRLKQLLSVEPTVSIVHYKRRARVTDHSKEPSLAAPTVALGGHSRALPHSASWLQEADQDASHTATLSPDSCSPPVPPISWADNQHTPRFLRAQHRHGSELRALPRRDEHQMLSIASNRHCNTGLVRQCAHQDAASSGPAFACGFAPAEGEAGA